MRRIPAVALPLLLALAACQESPAGATREAVVYGTDDRMEVYAHPSATHRAIAQTAIAVKLNESALDESDPSNVRVTYRRTLGEAQTLCAGEAFANQLDPGTCSGTLIDDQHLLTAGHCADATSDCGGTRVWLFGFRYTSAGVLARLTSDDVYRCQRILAYRDDSGADHAVVEFDRPVVGHTPVTVRTTASGLPNGTPVTMIGHPNGIPMKIDSGGAITWTSPAGTWGRATVDAFNGNSGSGVFDAAGDLVALLDSGETDYVSAGSCNVVNVIDPPPTDDGEGLTYLAPVVEALCATPGLDSPVCDCTGPCVPLPTGDRCEDAPTLSATSQTVTDTLVGYGPDTRGGCGGAGPDRVYRFTLDGRARFTARSQGFDTVLYLRVGCTGSEVACSDDVDPDTDRGSRIEATLDPGEYALFLDAYDGDVGSFTLTLTFEPLAEDPDAGPPPRPDAGPSFTDGGSATPDAGPPRIGDSGCACTTRSGPADAPWTVPIAMLAVLLRWRRGRR